MFYHDPFLVEIIKPLWSCMQEYTFVIQSPIMSYKMLIPNDPGHYPNKIILRFNLQLYLSSYFF
jgi:hypothetical protein